MTNHENRVNLAARSAFAITLFMLVSGMVGLPFMMLHRSANPVILRWSVGYTGAILAYAGLLVAIFFVLRWLNAMSEDERIATAGRLLTPGRLSALSTVLLAGALGYVLAAWAFTSIRVLSPQFRVVNIVLHFWAVMVLVLLAAMYRGALNAVGKGLRVLAIVLGVTVLALVGVELGMRASAAGRALVSDKFGPEVGPVWEWQCLPEEGCVPWAEDYWDEFGASANMLWTPYVYWRHAPFAGQFINVDEEGRRVTPPPAQPADTTVFVFGGSTIWGHGVRDPHTIPAELVRALDEREAYANVVNYGESGYVSRQDVLLFDLLLEQGQIPDVAVFYWGSNDVFSAWQQGVIGIPQNEANRAQEFDAKACPRNLSPGRMLVGVLYETHLGGRILSAAGVEPVEAGQVCQYQNYTDLSLANTTLTAYPDDSREAYVHHLQYMVDTVDRLAALHSIEVIYVWHPSVYLKEPMTDEEQRAAEQFPDMPEYFLELNGLVEEAFGGRDDFLLLGDFFNGYDETFFFDFVHVYEKGNTMIADYLADVMVDEGMLR